MWVCFLGRRGSGSTSTVAVTSLEPDGLIVCQVRLYSSGSAAQLGAEREVPGLELDVDLKRVLAVRQPEAGELVHLPARPDLRLAVPAAHVAEDPMVGVQLQPAGEVADGERELGPGDLAALAQVDLRVDGDESLGAARHRHARDLGVGLDRTAGLELVDDLAHIGLERLEQRLVDRHRVGLDVQLDHSVGPGRLDGPCHGQGTAADADGLHIDGQRPFLQGERAPEVVEGIGEMAVVDRDVVAGDLGAELDRPAGYGATQIDLRADAPAGLEEVPELEVLPRRPIAEPLIELEVLELGVQFQRLDARVAQPHPPPGPHRGRAVVAVGAMEREDSVLDVAIRGEVVDGIGELGAVPDAFAEPGFHGVMQPAAGRRLRVVADPHPIQVHHPAVERDGLERRPGLRRDPLADRLGERQAAQVPVERHLARVQVHCPVQPQAIEDIAPGRAVEPVQEGPDVVLLDPHAHVAEDRRDAARSPARGAGCGRRLARVGRTVVAADQLDGPLLDEDRRGLVQPGAGPRGREQALEVPGAVPALAEPQRRLDHVDLAHVQLAPQQLPGIHQDLQVGDAQRLEHHAVNLLIDPGIVERQLAEPARHADAARIELRAGQVSHGILPDPARRVGAVSHVGIGEPEPAAEDRQAEHQAPEHHLRHASADPHRVKPLPWGTEEEGHGAIPATAQPARTEPRPPEKDRTGPRPAERHPIAARPSAGISPGMR